MIQHYVPQVYLKNFAKKRGNGFFVDVYDKTEGRIFNANIKKICAEKDYYTLNEKGLDKDKLAVEYLYANQIEPIYSKSYKILTNDKISIISSQERIEILLGIFQLYTRNPQLLNLIKQDHIKNLEKVYNTAKSKNKLGLTYLEKDFSFREFTKEEIIEIITSEITKQYKQRHLLGTKEVLDFHKNSKLVISIARDNSEFLTSDNPLTFNDITTSDNHPLLKTKEFTIPLNSKYALTILHDKSKKLNLIYRAYIPNGSVASINSSIEDQCSRFIIGSKPAFDDFFQKKKFLNSTSLELRIDMFRQILQIAPKNEDQKESHELIKHYLNKYDKHGLNMEEQIEMHQKMREGAIKFKKGNI